MSVERTDSLSSQHRIGWIDYNGHLRDAYYGLVLSYATDDVMDQPGARRRLPRATHCTLYTLELHLHYLHEVKASDELSVESLVLDCDRKRIHLGSTFRCARVAEPVASRKPCCCTCIRARSRRARRFPRQSPRGCRA
jgi:acyl-CoA thioesterase FadM